MFDFDAGKLMIIATVALVVIGPKDLPRVLRQLGQMVTRVRRMASEFQNQFTDALKEADLQDLRAEVAKLKDSATVDLDFDPARDIKTHLDEAISAPVGSGSAALAGSTSETQPFHMPASSEITATSPMMPAEIETASSIAAAGFGPAVDLALPAPPDVPVARVETESSPPTDTPARAKVIIPRRRVASRFDLSTVRGPAMQRSRNILPARRETPES